MHNLLVCYHRTFSIIYFEKKIIHLLREITYLHRVIFKKKNLFLILLIISGKQSVNFFTLIHQYNLKSYLDFSYII